MLLREKLASDFAGIILGVVRNNGWLTEISDTVGINRKHFCRKQMSVMQLHRLLRILTALAWKTSKPQFFYIWIKLGKLIYEMGDENFYEFVDEQRNGHKEGRR